MLNVLRRLGDRKKVAERLSGGLSLRAREPLFFVGLGVPDTIDGRFDLLTLHAWLVLERLGGAGERELSQALINAIFIQFDEALRDLGVGDIGIGHRMKKMTDAFYGRLKAYGDAADETALADAVLRNVYRGEEGHKAEAHAIALYAMGAREKLARAKVETGAVDFGPLPEVKELHAS